MIFVQNITTKQAPLTLPTMLVQNRATRVSVRQLEGRDHYVVPMVMLTEGVHAGNNGPLLYQNEALTNSVPLWNGKPVVVYHPLMGRAGSPEVFTKQRVGVVFNASVRNGQLLADAWLDVERLTSVAPKLAQQVIAGNKIEVSTGLQTAKTNLVGVHNGKSYGGVATTIMPDHLALLPGQVGACSIKDGCGMGLTMNERTTRVLTRSSV